MNRLSVVIPTLNEARRLPRLLDDLAPLSSTAEVIVVDGGSDDDTVAVASSRGAQVVHGERSRARQLNAGARVADGAWLCFLHADTRLPAASRHVLDEWLAGADARTAAVFRFALDADGGYWRFIEFGQRLRHPRSTAGAAAAWSGSDCMDRTGPRLW